MITKTKDGKFIINGTYEAAALATILIDNAQEYFIRESVGLTSPEHAQDYIRACIAHNESEVFAVLFMDNRHRVISFDVMFHGTIDGASVYPREVVKRALEHNAAAVILAHNHPAGISTPSEADKALTIRLKDALALIDVRVIDHIIIGEDTYTFSEHGLI